MLYNKRHSRICQVGPKKSRLAIPIIIDIVVTAADGVCLASSFTFIIVDWA